MWKVQRCGGAIFKCVPRLASLEVKEEGATTVSEKASGEVMRLW